MDTGISASAAARSLGTSVPRVMRAIERLGLPCERMAGGRVRLSPRQVAELRRHLGSTPAVAGLSRTEARVLAALARAPLGLVSARAVAGRAGVSPTAAGDALRRLVGRGLVREERRVVAAGRARETTLFRANVASLEWAELAPALARVEHPARSPATRHARVPPRLRHLFWNTAPSQLDVKTHGPFIARRLLTSGDLEGLAWGRQHLAPEHWEHAARARGVEPRRRALARNLAAS